MTDIVKIWTDLVDEAIKHHNHLVAKEGETDITRLKELMTNRMLKKCRREEAARDLIDAVVKTAFNCLK